MSSQMGIGEDSLKIHRILQFKICVLEIVTVCEFDICMYNVKQVNINSMSITVLQDWYTRISLKFIATKSWVLKDGSISMWANEMKREESEWKRTDKEVYSVSKKKKETEIQY